MPREPEPWELCEKPSLLGVHIWVLSGGAAVCTYCGHAPPGEHRERIAAGLKGLDEQTEWAAKARKKLATLNKLSGRTFPGSSKR